MRTQNARSGIRNWREAPMPLYEFECKKCEHTFDKVMSIKEMDTIKLTCPECGSSSIRKLISSGRIKIGLEGYAGKVK